MINKDLKAQQKYLPLNYQTDVKIQRELGGLNNNAHTSMRPYLESDKEISKANNVFVDSGKYYYAFTQKLSKENLIIIKDSNFYATVDPLFNFQFSQDIEDDVPFRRTNTRGIIVRGDLKSKLSFSTSFYENQLRLPDYTERITDRGVVPGQGRHKKSDGTFDYAFSTAYLSYKVNDNFNLQAGHDKMFVGNGYRSMLMSDNSSNQLFIKAQLYFLNRKLKYTSWMSQLQSLERIEIQSTPEAYFKPKFGAFNYLSFKPNSRFEIGLFESVIYKVYQDSVGNVPLHYSAYVPVVMGRTMLNGLQSTNNAMIGVNTNLKLTSKSQLYGQVAIDDLTSSKFAIQVGLKFFDVFKVNNLYAQFEYNKGSKNVYGHTEARQSYTHYAQELAHPLGAWFDEILIITNYEFNKFFLQTKLITTFQTQIGEDYLGANILNQQIAPTEDLERKLAVMNMQDIQMGYKFNVKTNMCITWGVINRLHNPLDGFQHNTFIYVGFRTNLNNYYYDY